MKQKLKLLMFCLGISTFSLAQSQKLSPDIISASGGIDRTESIEVEWTLGELQVQSLTSENEMFTEGFHQPMLMTERVTKATELNKMFSVSVFPNPVSSLLTVNIHSEVDSKLMLNLLDLNGKVLSVATANSLNDSKIFDLSDYACGLYMLSIKNNSGAVIQSYKISKLQ